jgi:hypothetical protein
MVEIPAVIRARVLLDGRPMMRTRATVFAFFWLLAVVRPIAAWAQDDSPALGDVARNLRKSKVQQEEQQPPAKPSSQQPPETRTVIDNDNLAQAMEDARKARPVVENKTVFSLDPSGNRLKVSSPDVTCSMSFNARASSLLIKPVLIEDLPLEELLKLDGPGSIQDESLQLEVFNGTEWELREITVGLTLERKPGENAELAAQAHVVPAADSGAPVAVERRSDVTLLYHLKTEAKPFSKTAFHENIGIMPGPDEDWRWSIVEAKGIRPAGARVAPESLSLPLFGDPLPFVPSTNEPPGQGAVPTKSTPATPGVADKPTQETPAPSKIAEPARPQR